MSNKVGMSGKKLAAIVSGLIVVASIFAVIVITIFYNTYDPSKYGRNNGGIDLENTGVPAEAIQQKSSDD